MPKISELPSLASPAGTAFIPAVSSGVTYRSTLASLPISDLTATALATKALLAGSASQDFSAAALTATTVTASGTITGATVTSTGAVNGSSAAITNGVTAASVTTTGTVSGATVTSSGAVNGASASITGTATIGTMNATNSTITTGTVTTLTSTTANITTINGGQQAGLRNKIINGSMSISQRGASHVGTGSGGYTLDRWQKLFVMDGAVTITQQADSPSDDFTYSLRSTTTTPDTSIAAGQYLVISQPIEGYVTRGVLGKQFTLSFWVKSTKTGIHCVSVRNSIGDRSYVAEYTVSASNTWEKKSIVVPSTSLGTGTWNALDGVGLIIGFCLAVGSTFQTTAGSWTTGNFLGSSNQVNCLDTNGNIFAITGVQVESGTVATDFEHRHYGLELTLCERYYVTDQFILIGNASGAGAFVGSQISYPTSMRANPTITLGTPSENVNASSVTTSPVSSRSMRAYLSATGAGNAYYTNTYTASAEL